MGRSTTAPRSPRGDQCNGVGPGLNNVRSASVEIFDLGGTTPRNQLPWLTCSRASFQIPGLSDDLDGEGQGRTGTSVW